jgi:phosphoadenosine phosphosulfate reductase
VDPNIKVVFNNTGVEYPETYRYRDLLKEKWHLNLIETKPLKSFWQCIREYGFPLMRVSYSQTEAKRRKESKQQFHKPQCRIYLKELPSQKTYGEHKIEANLTGMRCAESQVRMFTLAQRGQYYHTSKWGSLWRYHPIGFWSQKQVREYFAINNLPINEIYKKVDRSGCMPCTGFLNWEKQLSKTNPKLLRLIQRKRGVNIIDNYLDYEESALVGCLPITIGVD